jgi:cysteine sulfinate desulfinase/cysteine desulfurase-like protein
VQNLVITSGGTESNNTVLRSVLENKPNPVAVISPFEHPAIDEVFKVDDC